MCVVHSKCTEIICCNITHFNYINLKIPKMRVLITNILLYFRTASNQKYLYETDRPLF